MPTPEANAYEVNQRDRLIDDHARLQETAPIDQEARQKSGNRAKQIDQSAIKGDKHTLERAADNVRKKLDLDGNLFLKAQKIF